MMTHQTWEFFYILHKITLIETAGDPVEHLYLQYFNQSRCHVFVIRFPTLTFTDHKKGDFE